MRSHTLLTCKSHANHNEEAGKHAGYNKLDSSEAITKRSLIFTKPKNEQKLSHCKSLEYN